MADDKEASDRTESYPLLRSLPAVLAGALASLAVIVYPFGMAAYWIQIWRDYTHDSTVALYAASLLPAPVAAGRALDILPAAFVTFFVATSASAALNIPIMRTASPEGEHSTLLMRLLFSRVAQFVIVFFQLFIQFGTGAMIPIALGLVTLDEATDVLFYSCAVVVAGVGGLFGSWLLLRLLKRTREGMYTVGPRFWSGTPLQIISTVVVSTIAAAVFLIPLHSPALADVRFSGITDDCAKLITHSQGYWYVIKSGDRSVTALPDQSVGKATITRPSMTGKSSGPIHSTSAKGSSRKFSIASGPPSAAANAPEHRVTGLSASNRGE